MVSNRTISIVLVFALVFSLSANIYVFNQVNSEIGSITGLASSQAGTATLTILSATDITLDNASIDFGTGVVNISDGCDNATLHTNGSGLNQDNCWVNSSVVPAVVNPAVNEKFGITNVGNVNVSITFTSARGNASYFIGNATSGSFSQYNFTANDAESGSCVAGLQNTWTNVTGAAQTVCSQLRYVGASNFIEVPILVVIPGQIDTTGVKNDTITFTSAQA